MSLVLLFHYLLLDMFRMLVIHLQELATYCGFMSCVVLQSPEDGCTNIRNMLSSK